MKIIDACPRETGFVLWGHCQNLLDDPRILLKFNKHFENEENIGALYFITSSHFPSKNAMYDLGRGQVLII